MSNERSTIRPTSRPLHLLWAIPVAALLSVIPFEIGDFFLCGISGCSGAGFGRVNGSEIMSFAAAGAIGLIFFVAIAIAPWNTDGNKRAKSGAIWGLLVALAVSGYFIWEKWL